MEQKKLSRMLHQQFFVFPGMRILPAASKKGILRRTHTTFFFKVWHAGNAYGHMGTGRSILSDKLDRSISNMMNLKVVQVAERHNLCCKFGNICSPKTWRKESWKFLDAKWRVWVTYLLWSTNLWTPETASLCLQCPAINLAWGFCCGKKMLQWVSLEKQR